jgi:flavin-dependent dehydrogenase
MSETDVLVLGAGPAGSAAAIRAAGTGLRVVLVERAAFPRHAPGETLHPGVEPLLARLGVGNEFLRARFPRHAGHWVRWGTAAEADELFVPFGGDSRGTWRGFQAWRPRFDAMLLARAVDCGVTVLQPCRPLAIVRKRGRATGIVTDRGPIAARFVIDATGRRAWLADHLGLDRQTRGPRRTAWYGYARGDCSARDEAPALRGDSTGWTWTARARRGLYHWTRLAFDHDRPRPQWLPEDLAHLARVGPHRAADVSWRLVDEPAGPGYLLTGDAACVLDPASSHGVLKALMTGMCAAQSIAAVAAGELDEREAAHRYARWLSDWFNHDVDRLDHFYARLAPHRAPTDSETIIRQHQHSNPLLRTRS